jgi:hypothetical protein
MRNQIFLKPWICIADARYCYHDDIPQTGEFGIYELGVRKNEERIRPVYIGHGELYFSLLNHATSRGNEFIRNCLDYYLEEGYSLYCRYKICWPDEAIGLEKSLKSSYLYDCNSFF